MGKIDILIAFLRSVLPRYFCSVFSMINLCFIAAYLSFYWSVVIIFISSNNITTHQHKQQQRVGMIDILISILCLVLSPFFLFISLLTFCSKIVIAIHFDAIDFHFYFYLLDALFKIHLYSVDTYKLVRGGINTQH